MKCLDACQSKRISRLIAGGGVVANTPLRERLKTVCADAHIEFTIPSMGLCTDNGAMVAGLGHHLAPVPLSLLSTIPDLRVEMN